MKKLEWCLEKGKSGGNKHRGLKKREPDAAESKTYLRKAEHNLDFADAVRRLGMYDDWVFPAAFYAMYHACLAILDFFGYESRNQECTFAALEELIKEGKISISEDDMSALRQAGERTSGVNDIRTLREDFQYGTKTKADKELVENAINAAKEFVEKAKGMLYLMYGEL
jgi:uncharacterized protein (UPF0332 family)